MSDVYLRSFRAVNFQTWKDTTIEFNTGLNVIIGENNTGKSVVLKALKLVATPNQFSRQDRIDYIRFGCDSAHCLYEFSNGITYLVSILPECNVYYKSDGENSVQLGDQPPKEFLDYLGVITNGNIIGNLIDTSQDMFLVDSNSNVNHNIVSALINDEDTMKVMYQLDRKIDETSRLLSAYQDKLKTYVKLSESFTIRDIDSLETLINNSEFSVNELEIVTGILEILDNVKPYQKINKEIYDSLNLTEDLNLLDSSMMTIKDCKLNQKDLDKNKLIINQIYLMDKFNSKIKMIESTKYIKDDVIKGIEISEDLIKVSECIEQIKQPKDLINTKSNLSLLEDLKDISSKVATVVNDGDLVKTIDELKEDLKIDKEGGEIFDCPIHGQIKYVDEECIPYYN